MWFKEIILHMGWEHRVEVGVVLLCNSCVTSVFYHWQGNGFLESKWLDPWGGHLRDLMRLLCLESWAIGEEALKPFFRFSFNLLRFPSSQYYPFLVSSCPLKFFSPLSYKSLPRRRKMRNFIKEQHNCQGVCSLEILSMEKKGPHRVLRSSELIAYFPTRTLS